MSASASKKKRKDLDEQGLSPKAIEARTKKEQQSRKLRSILSVVLTIAALAAVLTLVVKYVNKELNTPSYDVSAAIATVGAVYWIRGYRSKANPQTLAAAEKKGYNDGVNQTLTTKKMQHEDIGLEANNFVNN